MNLFEVRGEMEQIILLPSLEENKARQWEEAWGRHLHISMSKSLNKEKNTCKFKLAQNPDGEQACWERSVNAARLPTGPGESNCGPDGACFHKEP